MVSPKDSPFHLIYSFDYWIYSDWFNQWEKLAKKSDTLPSKLVQTSEFTSKIG